MQKRQNNDPHTFFVLSFSGGGTRAAAFSYGVLEELRRTEVIVNDQHRRLVDEVDLITGVSGGSFTALSYALYGDRLFCEYEERFLKRDVQGALTWRALNPFNWWKFIGGTAGRSEIAAEYYDEILFEGATFADLLKKPGVSETLDWAEALLKLHRSVLDEETVEQTLGCIFKYREDIQNFKSNIWPNPEKRTQLLTSYSE